MRRTTRQRLDAQDQRIADLEQRIDRFLDAAVTDWPEGTRFAHAAGAIQRLTTTTEQESAA